MSKFKRTAPIKAVEEGISYELLYFAREALRMLNGVYPYVQSVTLEDPAANPVDDIVLAFGPGGHTIGGEIFDAQYIQVKSGGTAADAFSSADLADPKCKWLATDKAKQAFLPRLARRWQLFDVAACLTLVTTRRWREGDPIARHLTEGRIDEDAVFRDRRCGSVLGKWQDATGFTEDQLRTFVRSICIVDGADSMETLRIDIATLARSLGIGDAQVVPQIDALVRGIFRSKDRTLNRNELIRQLAAAQLPVGKLPSRVVPVAPTAQEPLRGWLPRRPYVSAPLDVGAVWGMQTGAFACVVEGVSAHDVGARLASAQALLYLVLTRDSAVVVPRREWRVLESVSGRIDAKNVTDQLAAESPSIPRGLVIDLVDTRPATLDSLQDIARAMLRDGTDAIVVAVSRDVSSGQLALEDVIRALEPAGVSVEILKARPVSSQSLTPAADTQLLDLDISDLQRRDWTEVEQVLAAAATSANGEIRSRSLWIAASVDDWLDCWLDAYIIGDGSELLSFSAVPHARADATVGDVTLGLLRLGRNAPGRRDEVRAALERLDPLFDRDTRVVVSTWLVGGPAGNASDELFVRAGLSRAITIDSYAEHALLLQSDLPSRARLADFLKQEPAVRAILGLCTPEEWASLDLDNVLADDIVDLRFQRPLPQHGG